MEMDCLPTIQIDNINVKNQRILISPAELKARVMISDDLFEFVAQSRLQIERVLDRDDPRIIVVLGPCSIHDVDAALDYAGRLKALSETVSDTLLLVMRVYFEKPRTTVGWKGLINDPFLNDTSK